MSVAYPITIENCVGEKIIFQSVAPGMEGDKVWVEAFCQPGCGPTMHTHFKQEEELTVISGKMGYQVLGQEPAFVNPGESVLFKRGTPHKFWAAGPEVLHCKGWVQPANTIVFFLTALYEAQKKSGKGQPETFDGAYLMTRYAREYDLPEVPALAKKTLIPLTYFIGRLLGKYQHFRDAPAPVK